MNKEWSQANKDMQTQLKKETTYKEGIATLIALRKEMMDVLLAMKDDMSRDDFDALPCIQANGYHSKNIAYSIWHIARIEDIVAHSLIANEEQIFFKNKYQERIGSSIITTGNEFKKEEIREFTKQLNIEELYTYMLEVKTSTEEILKSLSYKDLKKEIAEEKKAYLTSLRVVSTSEHAAWLIDYWCNKNIKGLIQMPFSRHWIMHVDACLRIKNKLHH
ncbi:MAG: phage head-tail adapter protein [Longicatena sp.]